MVNERPQKSQIFLWIEIKFLKQMLYSCNIKKTKHKHVYTSNTVCTTMKIYLRNDLRNSGLKLTICTKLQA